MRMKSWRQAVEHQDLSAASTSLPTIWALSDEQDFPTLISDELGPAFVSKAFTSFLSSTGPFFTLLPKIGLKIMPSAFLGFSTQLGPEKALKLEQGSEWCGGRETDGACGEGMEEELANIASKEVGENRNLFSDQLWPLGIYNLSFPSPAKCPSITPILPLPTFLETIFWHFYFSPGCL